MNGSTPAETQYSRPSFDPGLTQRYEGVLKRAINKDGKFNVRRTGRTWHDSNPYMALINMPWQAFALLVVVMFAIVNFAFAGIYILIGVEHIKGAESPDKVLQFWNVFFFSTHTLTTVGYGNIYPQGPIAELTSALEALFGLMGFAIATGLLFGRFSRPSARFGFSDNALVAPYQGGTSLQFRVVNRRSNNLIDVEARMLLMTVERCGDRLERKFQSLELERASVIFFPLTWTVVHPIDNRSPLKGLTVEDLERMQAEVMIVIQGFDDTFSQTVHARYSYRFDEIIWGAKFVPAFDIEAQGDLLLKVDKVSEIELAPLPAGAL
jgi:inward rectifier potassium channel